MTTNLDGSDLPPARRRLPRVAVVLVAAGTVVALVVGLPWYFYPANRLRRGVDAIEMPRAIRYDGGSVEDNGWICFDSCSAVNRYYVTALSPGEAAPLVERAMRDAGFDGRMKPCQWTCPLNGPAEHDNGQAVFELAFDTGAGRGWAFVGSRADGTTGVMVWYIASG